MTCSLLNLLGSPTLSLNDIDQYVGLWNRVIHVSFIELDVSEASHIVPKLSEHYLGFWVEELYH